MMEHQSINETTFNSAEEQQGNDWTVRTGLTQESLGAAIEALIFVSEKPLSLNKIRDAIDSSIPLKVLHQAIEKLQVTYENKNHGIRLQEVALGYQFRTKATYSKILQSHLKISLPSLTPAMLEVLAIICYKQPISKTNIDLLRGVDSSHLVKTLIDRKLVTVSGRSEEEIGKPSLYATTPEFLEFFNLSSLDNLPTYEELEELAELDVLKGIPQVKEVLTPSDKRVFDFDDLMEIDDIANKIKDIPVDTDFTKKLRNPVEEIETTIEGQVEPVKTTRHLSAFDILENFVNKDESSFAANDLLQEEKTEDSASDLKEIPDEELDALLDAAFDKLKEFDKKEDSDDHLN